MLSKIWQLSLQQQAQTSGEENDLQADRMAWHEPPSDSFQRAGPLFLQKRALFCYDVRATIFL